MPRQAPSRDYGENPKERVGLPPRPFLYTIDQIATLLSLSEATIKKEYIYFTGRSTGVYQKSQMRANNIAPPDSTPEWRVSERDLLIWMRWKGFRYYERGYFYT